MTLAYLEWLSPTWGWALLAAAGVPLAAHLLSRRGGRLAVFPTIRFITQANAECAKFLRPRHWLMLLLRTLLAAAVVGAFARPIWFREASAAVAGRGVDAVFILDASASMRRTAGAATLFEQARQQVAEAIRALDPARDRASVIVLDAAPASLLPEMTANFAELAARVERVAPTWQQGDLLAALQLAVRPAAAVNPEADGQSRALSIHLLSDMQATQWPGEAQLRQALGDHALLLHPIGQAEANLAIGAASATPARPIVGQDTVVTAEVANYSGQAARVMAEMTFAGTTQSTTLALAAHGKAAARFNIRPTKVGAAEVRWRLLDASVSDALPADDRTGLFLEVAAARPVTMVTRAAADDPQTGAFFLGRALAPFGEKSDVALQVLQPEKLAERLGPDAAAPPPAAVAIVEAGRLDKAALEALCRYVERGGGVLWIADSSESAEALRRLKEAGDGQVVSPIVPASGAAWDFQADMKLEEARFDDPILSVFEGPSRTGLLEQRFSAVMHGTLTPGSERLLSFAKQEPALAARWAGAGRMAVLAAGIGPRQSDLVKGPAFVPLIQQLLKHLAPGVTARGNPTVGARPVVAVAGKWTQRDLMAHGPSGAAVAVTIVGAQDGQTLVEVESTPEPGAYEIAAAAGGRLLGGVYVDLAASESDLTAQVHPAGLDVPAGTTAGGGAMLMKARPEGVELWPYCVLAAFVLAGLEMVLAGLLGGAWVAAASVGRKEPERA